MTSSATCSSILVPLTNASFCNLVQRPIHRQMSNIRDTGSKGHLFWKQDAFRTLQIIQTIAAMPTMTNLLDLLVKQSNQLVINWWTSFGGQGKPKAHPTMFQRNLDKGQHKKRWLIVSSIPQKTQVLSPDQPLCKRLSLVKILCLRTNHKHFYFLFVILVVFWALKSTKVSSLYP